MIEREPQHNQEPEESIVVEIIANGAEFELRPTDTEIVRHIPKYKMYDFIYHDGPESAMYIFSEVELFEQLVKLLTDNGFPVHMNIQEVSDDDKQAYEDMLLEQMWNGIPPEFLE